VHFVVSYYIVMSQCMVQKTQRSYIVLIYVIFWIFYKSELWQRKLAPRWGYWLDNRWIVFRFEAWVRNLLLVRSVHAGYGAYPAPHSVDTRDLSQGSGGKAARAWTGHLRESGAIRPLFCMSVWSASGKTLHNFDT